MFVLIKDELLETFLFVIIFVCMCVVLYYYAVKS